MTDRSGYSKLDMPLMIADETQQRQMGDIRMGSLRSKTCSADKMALIGGSSDDTITQGETS